MSFKKFKDIYNLETKLKTRINIEFMNRFLFLVITMLLLISCGKSNDRGQLVGVKGKKWQPIQPHGMVLVPGGSFVMGKSDYDIAGIEDAPTKTVTVRSYYMDETEITNSEYRQFVHWVRDSVIRQRLAEEAEFSGGGEEGGRNAKSISDYAFKGANKDEEDQNAYQKFSRHYNPMDQALNWNVPIIWKKEDYPDEGYVQVMDEMYLSNDESPTGERTIDVSQLIYNYRTMDTEAAARNSQSRLDNVEDHETPVYPDTTAWVRDFKYSYNEPMHNNYFWHAAYDDYPVVGVTWSQAQAFSHWRTKYHNSYRKSKGEDAVPDYRLPSEAEWEFAARGGLEGATYPWGGPYTKNKKGCFMANFKPMRGDYAADQALYTVEAKSYEPNGYGLYNMAGNVSEWVNSSYDPSSYEFSSTINPSVNDKRNKRKVVRGGSWKDVAYYLQVSTRDYEYADSARSYIGFRTVQDYVGTPNQVTQRRAPQ